MVFEKGQNPAVERSCGALWARYGPLAPLEPEAAEAWTPPAEAVVRSRSTGVGTRCSGVAVTDAAPLDESEGVGRERWVLPYESVHGCLERAVHPARERLLRARRVDYVPNRPVGQGSQTPEMRVTCLWPLCGEVRRFDVFNEFRGGKNR